MNSLPQPRGEVTERLFEALRKPPHTVDSPVAPVADEDLHLALYCCYELHYRGFEGVDDPWKREPSLLALRAQRSSVEFEAIARLVGWPVNRRFREGRCAPARVIRPTTLRRSRAHPTAGDGEQLLEFTVTDRRPAQGGRSTLVGAAAAVEKAEGGDGQVQADEYGDGSQQDRPRELFAARWRRQGSTGPTAHTSSNSGRDAGDGQPDVAVGLHRRLAARSSGHLALFEITSLVPNRRYATGLRRLGYGDDASFLRRRVVADAVHESVARRPGTRPARIGPRLGADILWRRESAAGDRRPVGAHMMQAWGDACPPCAGSRCVHRSFFAVERPWSAPLARESGSRCGDLAERPEPRLPHRRGDDRLATAADLVAVLVLELNGRGRAVGRHQVVITVSGSHPRSVLRRGAPQNHHFLQSLVRLSSTAASSLRVAPAGSGRAVPARGPRCSTAMPGSRRPADSLLLQTPEWRPRAPRPPRIVDDVGAVPIQPARPSRAGVRRARLPGRRRRAGT